MWSARNASNSISSRKCDRSRTRELDHPIEVIVRSREDFTFPASCVHSDCQNGVIGLCGKEFTAVGYAQLMLSIKWKAAPSPTRSLKAG
jgi:hypothetical protein